MTIQRFGTNVTYHAGSIEEVEDLLILFEDGFDFQGQVSLAQVLDYFYELKIMPPEEFIDICNHDSALRWGWFSADPIIFGPVETKPFVIFPPPKLILRG